MIDKERVREKIDQLKDRGNEMFDEGKVVADEMKVKGGQLVDRVREIIDEGKARRIIIRRDDRTLAEFPLLVGAGGTVAALWLMPTLAAVGAIAALVSDVTVVIERDASDPSDKIQIRDES